MKSITINVKIKGGKAPVNPTIRIIKDNDTTDKFIKIGPKVLLDEKINLESGSYIVMVDGLNPYEGSAEVSITGTFIDGPYPSSKKTTTLSRISAVFFFTI